MLKLPQSQVKQSSAEDKSYKSNNILPNDSDYYDIPVRPSPFVESYPNHTTPAAGTLPNDKFAYDQFGVINHSVPLINFGKAHNEQSYGGVQFDNMISQEIEIIELQRQPKSSRGKKKKNKKVDVKYDLDGPNMMRTLKENNYNTQSDFFHSGFIFAVPQPVDDETGGVKNEFNGVCAQGMISKYSLKP